MTSFACFVCVKMVGVISVCLVSYASFVFISQGAVLKSNYQCA